MKKGRFTATVIAMLMLAQPVYAQDVTSTMISTEMWNHQRVWKRHRKNKLKMKQ